MSLSNWIWEQRDVRLDDWTLMSSPWPTLLMSGMYVYVVTFLGPRMMKNRPAFQLNGVMMAYNLLQVVVCSYLVYESAAAGWFTGYNWICQDVDRDGRPGSQGMRMVYAGYLYLMTKLADFTDTAFFIARKKMSQVTALHVIHHSVMPIFIWISVRFLPGGHESLAMMINSFVHVVMYSYYFLAAFGPRMHKFLWWKKYLTTLQIIQFVVILIRSSAVAFGVVSCGFPRYLSFINVLLMLLFLFMFSNFYIQSYTQNKKVKAEKETQ